MANTSVRTSISETPSMGFLHTPLKASWTNRGVSVGSLCTWTFAPGEKVISMKKPMSPTLSFSMPTGEQWVFEVKYDGFRCLIHWEEAFIKLISKNGIELNTQFPEIVAALQEKSEAIAELLPLLLDGEIVVLENPYKSNFGAVQKRGRLKNRETIEKAAKINPASYVSFDLLKLAGKGIEAEPYKKRRNKLEQLFTKLAFQTNDVISYVQTFDDFHEIEKIVQLYDSEGIVGKLQTSQWETGKTRKWTKMKNWKKITAFITMYEKNNGYFHVSVIDGNKKVPIGLFSHGLENEERTILKQVIHQNKTKETNEFIFIEPSICVEINCLELYQGQLREPYFHRFRTDLSWEECTLAKLYSDLKPIPESVAVTNESKLLWSKKGIKKEDYLRYLLQIAPYALPFLNERVLTVIRFPDGVEGEAFYQKNCPDYAPAFVETHLQDEINYIVCNNLETYMWLGNQAAIEFHLPFQTRDSSSPSEIVFDLDPPSREHFRLAIIAAQMIKEICDELKLITFIKTSGNKGLQVYIPLPEQTYSYDDTRAFTSFIAEYLVTKRPDIFTIERLKKNRGEKLYIDFIQHAEGKTIISPYSARGNEHALVATPLFWEEITEDLTPLDYTILNVYERISKLGCPFSSYFEAKKEQPFQKIIEFLTAKRT